MRKILTILFVQIILSSGVAYADWLDDYIGTSVSTSPTAFKSQQRSYYSAGGFTARVPHRSEPLLTIQKPSIKSGCGGIDTFFGGVSFLNPEYLVKKAEALLKNAPYIIFSIGLKALSTQFADTIEAANAITDQLNQLQFDECGASKGLVGLAMGDGAPGLVSEFEKMSTNAVKFAKGLEKNFTTSNSKVNKNPAGEKKKAIDGIKDKLDSKVYELLTGKGFLLDKLVEWGKNDANPITMNEAYAIRALVGDVYYDNKNPNIPDGLVQITVGCASGLSLNDYMITPTPSQPPLAPDKKAVCSYARSSLTDTADNNINLLFAALTNPDRRKVIIDSNIANFVGMSSLPILSYLSDVSVLGEDYLDATQSSLVAATASDIAYGSLVRLSNNVSKVMEALVEGISQNDNYVINLLSKLKDYQRNINDKQVTFRQDYIVMQNQFNTTNQVIKYLKDTGKNASEFKSKLFISQDK